MKKFRSVFRVLAISFLVLMLAACSSTKLQTNDKAEIYNLPDGSLVLLNKGSEMNYIIDAEQRQVSLNGEAHFKVVKGEVPFVVSTTHGSVKVLGTEFNVVSSEDELGVEVDDGEVEVLANNEKKRLKKGERVLYNDAKKLFKKGKAEFKHHIWTDDFKDDMRYLGKEIEKGGKKLGKGLKKLGKDIEKKLE